MFRTENGSEDGLVGDHRVCEPVSWQRSVVRLGLRTVGRKGTRERWMGKGKRKKVDVRGGINIRRIDALLSK